MTLTDYLTFLLIAVVATASPGPAVLLAVTNAVTHGVRRTLFAILGNVLGILLLAALASAGLGTLLQTSELLFQGVKWIGGLYLVYLGIRLWRKREAPMETACQPIRARNRWQLFMQAFAVALTNPKAMAFIVALFPQFIEPSLAMLPQFALLAGTFGLLSFSFLAGYALLASRSSHWFSHSRWQRRFNRASGGLFIGLGTLMVTTER